MLARRLKKLLRRPPAKKVAVILVVLVLGICTIVYAEYMANKRLSINPAAHAPLLKLIGRVESSNNYNAYFGAPANNTIDFTSMSVAEVMAWQKDFIQQGSPSSAVGRYQIISTTLSGLVEQLAIDTSKKFDKPMQDRLAIALIERRGAVAYVNNELSREEFAANLSKEWAALPRIFGENPEQSYYASDGLNQSRVKVNEVLAVIGVAYGIVIR